MSCRWREEAADQHLPTFWRSSAQAHLAQGRGQRWLGAGAGLQQGTHQLGQPVAQGGRQVHQHLAVALLQHAVHCGMRQSHRAPPRKVLTHFPGIAPGSASVIPLAHRHWFGIQPSPRDWLPEGHLALFLQEVVSQLDLSVVLARYPGGRGPRGYHPQMPLTVLLYGYCLGVMSSRRIARACEIELAFRVLSGGSSRTSAPRPTSACATWRPLAACSRRCCGSVKLAERRTRRDRRVQVPGQRQLLHKALS